MSVKRGRGDRSAAHGVGHSPVALSYRGAAGFVERYFVAELDADHQVRRRLSPEYETQIEGYAAWLRRRDRSARLVREIVFRSVEA